MPEDSKEPEKGGLPLSEAALTFASAALAETHQRAKQAYEAAGEKPLAQWIEPQGSPGGLYMPGHWVDGPGPLKRAMNAATLACRLDLLRRLAANGKNHLHAWGALGSAVGDRRRITTFSPDQLMPDWNRSRITVPGRPRVYFYDVRVYGEGALAGASVIDTPARVDIVDGQTREPKPPVVPPVMTAPSVNGGAGHTPGANINAAVATAPPAHASGGDDASPDALLGQPGDSPLAEQNKEGFDLYVFEKFCELLITGAFKPNLKVKRAKSPHRVDDAAKLIFDMSTKVGNTIYKLSTFERAMTNQRPEGLKWFEKQHTPGLGWFEEQRKGKGKGIS